MTLLQQIKSGDVYIRTKDDRDLALVLNFSVDNEISVHLYGNSISSINFFGKEKFIFFSITSFGCPALGITTNLDMLGSPEYVDITDQFFSEVAK